MLGWHSWWCYAASTFEVGTSFGWEFNGTPTRSSAQLKISRPHDHVSTKTKARAGSGLPGLLSFWHPLTRDKRPHDRSLLAEIRAAGKPQEPMLSLLQLQSFVEDPWWWGDFGKDFHLITKKMWWDFSKKISNQYSIYFHFIWYWSLLMFIFWTNILYTLTAKWGTSQCVDVNIWYNP